MTCISIIMRSNPNIKQKQFAFIDTSLSERFWRNRAKLFSNNIVKDIAEFAVKYNEIFSSCDMIKHYEFYINVDYTTFLIYDS